MPAQELRTVGCGSDRPVVQVHDQPPHRTHRLEAFRSFMAATQARASSMKPLRDS